MAASETHPDIDESTLREMAGSTVAAYVVAAAHHPDTPDDVLPDIVERDQAGNLGAVRFEATIAVANRRALSPHSFAACSLTQSSSSHG